MGIRAAIKEQDHKQICAIAKESKHTSAFSHMMFSGDDAYEKGWIQVAEDETDGSMLGFYCVRHKTRTPATSLYFITITEDARGLGIGSRMLQHLEDNSPHTCVELNVMKNNPDAIRFYERHGYKIVGESLKGKGVAMKKEW